MLLIAGTIDFDPAHRDAAVAACVALQQATRSEAGCHAYAFCADLEDDGRLHVMEKWDSQDALDAHFATPHIRAFGRAVAGIGISGQSILRYEIASEGPLR